MYSQHMAKIYKSQAWMVRTCIIQIIDRKSPWSNSGIRWKDIPIKDESKIFVQEMNTWYKKDELCRKFPEIENFKSNSWAFDTYIQEFLIKLDLLGFTLLKAVNLSSIHKQLAKVMATHIDY